MDQVIRTKPRSLESAYFEWLVSKISDPRPGTRTYVQLAALIHEKFFGWSIPNDENRAEDGIALRHEFLRDYDLRNIHVSNVGRFLARRCSVFEMMVGLSLRIEGILATEGDNTFRWFEQMIKNLGLYDFNDHYMDGLNQNQRFNISRQVGSVIEKMVNRDYDYDGQGSLYPSIKKPTQNLAETEIWYQMHLFYADRDV